MDDRRLTAEATFHVAIQTVEARIQLTTNEPETNMITFFATVYLNKSSVTHT